MTFSFSDAVNSQNASRKPLEGNKIHEVTFDGCEARDFAGVQDPTKLFKVLDIKFSNNDGVFTHTVWQPRAEDFEDRMSGAGYKQPANALATLYLFKHLIDAVNPEVAAKINNKELVMNMTPDNWDEIRQFMVKHTEAAKGKQTKIKLIDNRGKIGFPYFLSYDRNGRAYMSTNFIGDGIYFTTKESERIAHAAEAKPTTNLDAFTLPESSVLDTDLDDDI